MWQSNDWQIKLICKPNILEWLLVEMGLGQETEQYDDNTSVECNCKQICICVRTTSEM